MSAGRVRDGAAAPAALRQVTIGNRKGMHARAAARFVKLAQTFEAEIWVAKRDAAVSGRSIMGLMMLAAGPGCQLELRASGPAADAALTALAALIERKFDED
jgi:phosphocarrier protein